VVLYGLGVTIGAGIYVLVAASAGRAGVYAPVSFVITAVLVGLTGASLAELGVRCPVAAGEAAFVRAGFRSERMAVLIGLLVIAVALISAATITVGAAGYVAVFVPLPRPILIAAIALAMGAIAGMGVKESVTFAGLMTLVEIGGLVTVIGAGFLVEPAIIARAPEMLPLTLDPDVWSGIATASMLAVFAFIGFEGIVNISEEIEEPGRVMPRAILLTLVITTTLYVLVMWVALAALGVDELARSEAPLADLFSHLTGASPRVMSAVAIVATLNGIVFNIIMASRVAYGLARDGSLPEPLARLNASTQTPLFGTALGTAIVLAFALVMPIAELADLSSRLILVVFALVNAALVLIKRREAAPPAGLFTVPGWVPAAGLLSSILFIAADALIGWRH
jgi:amino acid transporter